MAKAQMTIQELIDALVACSENPQTTKIELTTKGDQLVLADLNWSTINQLVEGIDLELIGQN